MTVLVLLTNANVTRVREIRIRNASSAVTDYNKQVGSTTSNSPASIMLVDGPHFQATDEGELVFLLSDGDDSRRPTEHDILEPEEEDHTLKQNYYLQIPPDHPDSHRWRTEIAKYLAPLVLGSTYPRLTHTTPCPSDAVSSPPPPG
jgi:hypothetical protein